MPSPDVRSRRFLRIDPRVLTELSAKLKTQLRGMEEEAYEMAGGPFNIASPSQVGMVLFDRLQIDSKAKKTAKGSYSTTVPIWMRFRLLSILLPARYIHHTIRPSLLRGVYHRPTRTCRIYLSVPMTDVRFAEHLLLTRVI